YFSAEFGFHESIPNYSGGLGILAGDHCKSASDLDLNFVAIGLLYRHGYFRQQIDKDGVQAAINLNQNFYHLPIREVRRGETKLLISVPILDREVFARVWELRVGRVNVYLLDTDVPENSAEDRRITAELYGGDLEMRMRQEMMLGIGGGKKLPPLGHQPARVSMERGPFGEHAPGEDAGNRRGQSARRAWHSASRVSHERRTFGVPGAGTYSSQCRGEED